VRELPGGATLELSTAALDGQPLDELVDALDALPGVESVESDTAAGGLQLRLYVSGGAPLLVGPAATILAEHGLDLADVAVGSASLEDVFIKLTGRALR
jgi:ABC-2 type transport system ATP-binding protein